MADRWKQKVCRLLFLNNNAIMKQRKKTTTLGITREAVKARLIQIKDSLSAAFESVESACKDYVALTEQYPETPRLAREVLPEVPAYVWERMIQVGSGQVSARLIALNDSDYRTIARLPKQLQDEVVSEGVQVYQPDGKGRVSYAVRSIYSLTPVERKFVFDAARVRTPAEQEKECARLNALADSARQMQKERDRDRLKREQEQIQVVTAKAVEKAVEQATQKPAKKLPSKPARKNAIDQAAAALASQAKITPKVAETIINLIASGKVPGVKFDWGM